ncbi:MAG: SUMF1/EgtB/PvdO family nonheme iron enzyme [Candidatus Marinimicrobia bacterium]|nr:SUMF1/EgtB/PvdO family nonheme iron enzyme [Candidatus Neomarinimicrobiota bacterium]
MRKFFIFPMLLILFIIFACENIDNTPPEVLIDSPISFAPISDIALIEITATDDEEMSRVELYVDGEATGLADSTLPYVIELNTYLYENKSSHILVVRAWDASGNYTDSESIRVLVENTANYPQSIDLISIVYEDLGFTLTWDKSSDEDFAAYKLMKFTGSLMDSAIIIYESANAEIHSFRDTEIDPLVQYYYKIAVVDSFGLQTVGAHNLSPAPSLYVPTGVSSSVSDHSIKLRWNDNTPFELGFLIERDDGVGFKRIAIVGKDTTGFVDDSLKYDIQYRYRVAAFTASNQTDYSLITSIYSPLKFAPSSLAATSTDTSIILTWQDNALFEEGFKLERNKSGVGYIQIAELGANATTYTDYDLDEDVYYSYRIKAFTATSASDYTSSSSIISPIEFAPTQLAASTSGSTIVLRWNDNCKFESGFRLERDEGDGFKQIAELVANITGYTDTNLVYDQIYKYQVAAFTASKQSNYTQSYAIGSPLQFAPSNLSATAGDTTISLAWSDNANFETGFRVERRTDAGYVLIAELGANITSFIDDDLAEDEFYSYRVAAFTSARLSDYSGSVSISSPIQFSPSGLTASTLDNTIVLRWTDNCIFESGFSIERDAGAGFSEIGTVGADTTAFTDVNLVYGVEYRYRVRALAGTKTSNYTVTATINSPLRYAPTNLAATAGDTTILLTWKDNSIFEDGFRIQRDSGAGFMEIAELGANTESYSDNALEENANYTYRIAAFTSASESDYSAEVSVASPLIFAPTNLTATVINNSIKLRWEDACIFEDGFRIERDAGSGFSQIAEIGANLTSYTDNYLAYNTEYTYRVAAFDGAEESDFSNEVNAQITYLGMEWVTVTGGDYTFGPSDVVTGDLSSEYEIMKFEVTNAQYVSFLEEVWAIHEITVTADSVNGAYAGDGNWGTANYLYYDFKQTDSRIDWNESYFTIEEGYENHPVVAVTWFGAHAYAQHYGWDLPTDKEWEKAARGNTGFDYPWGDDEPTCDLANYSLCNSGTIPVGQTSGVSPYGAYDMIGNAWEWTNTYDPEDFDGSEDNRTIRGGSWSFYTNNMKAWNWLPANPKHSYYLIGFRCVK